MWFTQRLSALFFILIAKLNQETSATRARPSTASAFLSAGNQRTGPSSRSDSSTVLALSGANCLLAHYRLYRYLEMSSSLGVSEPGGCSNEEHHDQLPNSHHPFCDLPGDPSILLTTNMDLGGQKLDVMKSISKSIAKHTGKPESYVGTS
jgi:hypothetical protein